MKEEEEVEFVELEEREEFKACFDFEVLMKQVLQTRMDNSFSNLIWFWEHLNHVLDTYFNLNTSNKIFDHTVYSDAF